MKRKVLSVLMILALCLAVLPGAALAAEDGDVNYLALGDSITTGYGLTDASSEGFVAKLGALLGAGTVANCGENGKTAAELVTELQSGSYDEDIIAADVISITIGGNDLLAALYDLVAEAYNAAYGSSGTTITAADVLTILADPSGNQTAALALINMLNSGILSTSLTGSETFQSAVTTCLGNIGSIVLYIQSVNSDAVILLANQYNPYQWLGYEEISSLFSTGVSYFNQALSASAGRLCSVVDAASAFAASDASLTNAGVDYATGTYSFDFHPNADGHEVLAEAMLTAYTAVTSPTAQFTDVDAGAWYYEYVTFALESGLMVGTGTDTFEPNTATSRGMLVTILYRLEGAPEVSGSSEFTDVADGQWYAEAVIWAADNGIVDGYDNGKYGPEDDLTREQMATILYRYAQYKGLDVSVGEDTNILSFNDAESVSEYAIPAIQWAVGAGIIEGADSNLSPAGSATRAQAAAILMRFIMGAAA